MSEQMSVLGWIGYGADTGDHAAAADGINAMFADEIDKIKARYNPTMREEERLDLVEIGTDMGIFAIINMLLEGATFDRELLKNISELCAAHIEEVSGMPAVVFQMMTKPAIEQLIKQAKEKSNGRN